MIITIPRCKCPTWNAILYKHWRVGHRIKQDLQSLAYGEAVDQVRAGEPITSADISITAFFKGGRKHDPDNLFVKPILDALVKARILKDDNGAVIRSLTLRVEKAKEDSIEIEIDAIL